MNIVISAGGRFHALQLAHQLEKRNSLRKLCTFDYTDQDAILVQPKHVHSVTSCKIMNDMFVRLQLARFVNKAHFNVFKDNLFDRLVSKKIARYGSFDLFVGWAHYALNSISAARKAGAKIIIESGSCHILAQQKLLHDEYRKWGLKTTPIDQRTVTKMLQEYQQADYIMTLSSFAQQSFIQQGIAPEKVLKVPCGVDVDFFLRPNILHTKFRVIFVGLVTLRKGIQYLLQAWHKAQLPTNQAELIIAGPVQKDFEQIKNQLPRDAHVTFVGPTSRSKLRELYQQSSLFVLPSIEDGFGMVIGEAMASGLPVICSTHTAAPELIQDQKHGFLVGPGDVDTLAEKIRWCYNNRDQAWSMGQAGKEQIKAFTWDHYGQQISATYQTIVDGS